MLTRPAVYAAGATNVDESLMKAIIVNWSESALVNGTADSLEPTVSPHVCRTGVSQGGSIPEINIYFQETAGSFFIQCLQRQMLCTVLALKDLGVHFFSEFSCRR